jgi:hypothetical protein
VRENVNASTEFFYKFNVNKFKFRMKTLMHCLRGIYT